MKNLKKIFKIISIIIFFSNYMALQAHNETNISLFVHYPTGLQVIEIIKKLLGIITILGALGFFITSSPRRNHWPFLIRRTFFGIFLFCNIISQLIFNVINLPSNKKLVCLLGDCATRFSHKPTKIL